MEFQERAEQAAALRQSGYNCCQAVTAALADLTELSAAQLKALAAGFGAGMGNQRATCGALIGAGMVAGLATDGKQTVRAAKQISEAFQRRCGAVTCRELKAVTDGAPLCPCEDCVRNAVLAYGEALGQR